MFVSSVVFTVMGEPQRTAESKSPSEFIGYLRKGIGTFSTDRVFRHFVFAQWCGGGVLVAAPFFIVAAADLGVGLENVALLLWAQTAGALICNPAWGWWGDRMGKFSLMIVVAILRAAPPLILIVLVVIDPPVETTLVGLTAVFFVLGAFANGLTIAVIGLLMEISLNDRRPAYSGYFNT